MTHASVLQQVPLFAQLSPPQLQHLARRTRLLEVPACHLLFEEGETGDRFFIVLAGRVEIIKAVGTPGERILGVRSADDFFGEMSLLNPGRLRTAAVRTTLPTRLLELAGSDFVALFDHQPTVAVAVARRLSLRLQEGDSATIRDLETRNRELERALDDLRAAQAHIVEEVRARERSELELRLAWTVQRTLLPADPPDLPGWQIAAHYRPARVVGGDFYDFLPRTDGRLGIVIGDVSDKGVPAALMMATTRSFLRGDDAQDGSPGAVLRRVNNLLCHDMPPGMFVTCLYAVLEPATGHLRWANAGHCPPYHRTEAGVLALRATGMMLGLMPDMRYEEHEAMLGPGTTALFYSDGLLEARNINGELLGHPRLSELVAQHGDGSALIDTLLLEMERFTGSNKEQEDDITLVALTHSRDDVGPDATPARQPAS